MKGKIAIICFLFSTALFAQWTTQTNVNTLVASSVSSDMKAIATVSGKTAIVFWKAVAGPVNYELRMQVLDANGQQLLGPDGVLVSNNMSMSTSTAIMRVATDDNENIYIGATGTNGGVAFAFKMSINGLPLWGANGLNLGSGYMITIKPLTNGEVLIARNASNQILYRKYSSAGVPLWPAELQVTNGSTNNKSPGDLFELPNQEFLLVFHTFSFGVSSTLWAQKYSSSGAPIWPAPIQLSNKATQWNTLYSSAQDQDVVYYGYKAATGSHFDSFLQRINPDGTLPWGINGKDFDITTIRNEMDTKIAYQNGSPYIWSICNYANSAQGAFGVYIQKFDKITGNRLFTDTAKVIYPIGSSRVAAGDLLLISDQPVFLMKDGFDNGATPTTLNACFLNGSGNFIWTNQFVPMATFSANKSRIHFSKNGVNSVVASFVEEKVAGSPKIFAHSQAIGQNVTTIQNVSACDSFQWINNVTYTTSTNLPSVVYPSASGGDSTVVLNLTITPSTFDTLVVNTCGAYTWNGNTYTDAGIYLGPTSNCHTPVLELIIAPLDSNVVVVSSCDSYSWNGQSYNASGLYYGDTLNCTIQILDLTVQNTGSDTSYVSACGSYLWNGQSYTQSGMYTAAPSNCITPVLVLTVDSISNQVTAVDMTLTALENGVNSTYQWIDCATQLPISNANGQSYTATVSGSYAVIVSNGICSDTSICMAVSDAGILEAANQQIEVFPNPSTGIFYLKNISGGMMTYSLIDMQGRHLSNQMILHESTILDGSNLANGSYFIKVENTGQLHRIVKN